MSADLLVGLLLGTAWALIDVWLLRRAIKRAYAVPKQAQRIICLLYTSTAGRVTACVEDRRYDRMP